MPPEFVARSTQKPTIEKRRTCSNCGRLGHLVSTCENHERHHDMIGIEVEGWWWDLPGIREKARTMCGHEGTRDGSLRDYSSCTGRDEDDPNDFDEDTADCEDGCDDCPHPIERRNAPNCSARKPDCKVCGARGWEIRTKPGSVGEALRQLTTLYPDITSKAAGMHVHMSFKEKTSISLLCSKAFFKFWQERWEEWGTRLKVKGVFWERVRGENTYCRKTEMSEWGGRKGLVNSVGERYRAINFTSFEKHGTVEFRMLPMFQKGNLAVLAIENLVDIVETFLQNVNIDTVLDLKTKIGPTPDSPVELEPVISDFDLPQTVFEPVIGEVDLDEPFKCGPVLDDKGNPTGVVRIFRHQVPEFYEKLAADANAKKKMLADPRANKVVWADFDPNP